MVFVLCLGVYSTFSHYLKSSDEGDPRWIVLNTALNQTLVTVSLGCGSGFSSLPSRPSCNCCQHHLPKVLSGYVTPLLKNLQWLTVGNVNRKVKFLSLSFKTFQNWINILFQSNLPLFSYIKCMFQPVHYYSFHILVSAYCSFHGELAPFIFSF